MGMMGRRIGFLMSSRGFHGCDAVPGSVLTRHLINIDAAIDEDWK
jgi:hypothetical protein